MGRYTGENIEVEVFLFSHNALEGMDITPSKIYPLIDHIII